jgi:PAS domain S-box-containing protein
MYELADRQLNLGISSAARTSAFRYGLAFVLVGTALCLSLLLHSLLSDSFLVLFFAAVMASGWIGRAGPGLFAAFLSTIAFSYFFVMPLYSFAIDRGEVPYVLSFLLSAILASWLSSTRKHVEESQRAHLDELFEQAPEAIMLLDLDGRVLRINQEFSRMFGFPPEETKGKNGIGWIVPDELQHQAVGFQQRLGRGEKINRETVRMRRDGTRLHVSELAVPIFVGGRRIADYMIFRDITESKQAAEALHAAQTELAHLARLTTLGELMASIAHEVNQPVAAILTNSNAGTRWLGSTPPNLEEANEALGRIARDANRVTEVIARLRALAKKNPAHVARLDPNELIRSVLSLTEEELQRAGVAVDADLSEDLPGLMGDRVQLQQVVLNLIMNSIDAMAGVSHTGRKLLLRSFRSGDSVVVRVEDTGTGLDPEQIHALFQPFFTTKPQGIGLGLSISRSIIEAHGGSLWAEPRSAGGAVFQFALPTIESLRE